MIRKILYAVSIIVNPIYVLILRTELYTDTYHLPEGETGVNHRSPIESLYHADQGGLFTLELVFMAVSIMTSILLLCGVKDRVIQIVQIVSTIASTVLFFIILIVAGNVHLKY